MALVDGAFAYDGRPSPRESWLLRGSRFALVAVAHAALLLGAVQLAARPELRPALPALVVGLIQEVAETPVTQKARPLPPSRHEVVRRPLTPPPVLAVASEALSAASFAVPVQPPAAPLPPVVAAEPAPAARATTARFDADYLHNPKPVYPALSRRQGEEGKVLLRVRVSADGRALAVELHQSSGSMRLDVAAREAVERWRFVPARLGSEAVESWVIVPISFSLQS